MTEKIIFDCDNTLGMCLREVDDGLALLYLLGTPELELLGVTTTFGNGRISQVYTQTKKFVKQLHLDLPVLKGEGEDTKGKLSPAANFLVESVNRFPGEVTILATGPVGNLHTAQKQDSEFYRKVKRIAVMGGYLQPLILGYRNLKELNFSANPEAAMNLLSAPCPLTVFSAQACLQAPFRLKDIQRMDFWPGWLKRTLVKWLLAFGLYTGMAVFYLWDLLPAVFLARPDFFDVLPFRLGSFLDDIRDGRLIESKLTNQPGISLGMSIRDQDGFFKELKRGWRKAASDYPLG